MNFPFLRTAQTEFEKAEVKNREREVKWAATVSGNRTRVPGFEGLSAQERKAGDLRFQARLSLSKKNLSPTNKTKQKTTQVWWHRPGMTVTQKLR